MSDSNQDFDIYSGDDASVQFTVYSDADNTVPLDLSSASAITWTLYDKYGAAVLTKTKASGAIAFVSDGKDGVIAVAIAHGDTPTLSGWYSHSVVATDALSNVFTAETGRLLVKSRTLGD